MADGRPKIRIISTPYCVSLYRMMIYLVFRVVGMTVVVNEKNPDLSEIEPGVHAHRLYALPS